MSSPRFIAICPVEPVNKTCPVALEFVDFPLPTPLSFQTFTADVAPAIIGALLMAWGFKTLRRMVFNR